MTRRALALLLAVVALLGPLAAGASGRQNIPAPPVNERDVSGVPTTEVTDTRSPVYSPAEWEPPDLQFPALSDDVIIAVHEDDDSLKFLLGSELGGFRTAPRGGSAFYGQGRPIFGIAAPPILPSRLLRPLGGSDQGDRFLGAPPRLAESTVIPKIGDTYDSRRHAYAFINGVPDIETPDPGGTTPFPLPETVVAGRQDPTAATTTTTTPTRPSTTTTTNTTSRIPTTTTPSPGTTIPARPTTTSSPSTTTTTRPSTTTSAPTTTTTTAPTTTTTRPPTTTTAPPSSPTTTPPPPPPPRPSTTFVLGNQRSAAAYCLSNASGGSDKDCDRLFNLSDVRPGQPQQIDLTLWNVDPDSDTDAEALRLFGSSCTSGIANPSALAGSGNLCDGLELTVRRYDTSARLGAGVCIIGCDATANTSLTDLAQNHGSFATGASLDTDFRVNERAYLVVTITLPDTGATSDGRGRDNRYLNRTAAIALTWQMLSA